MDQKMLVDSVIEIALEAGEAIMQVYNTDFSKYEKSDGSPLTEADLAAHHIIVEGLARLKEHGAADIPCLSEESDEDAMAWSTRQQWQRYWLVDPLDGTKEFINKSDEFTVNIALINEGRAVLGVVYCPATGLLYFAEESLGAFKRETGTENGSKDVAIQVADASTVDKWRVVGSKRHGAEALADFAQGLGEYELVSIGSSLKLCLVAEGKADLYPRLAPACEWDTAAAHAIVSAAGGQVLGPDLQPLMYGQKEDLLNPNFVVCSQLDERWASRFQKI